MSWFSKKDDDEGIWGWLGRMVVAIQFVPRIGPYAPVHMKTNPSYPPIMSEVTLRNSDLPWMGRHIAMGVDSKYTTWSIVEVTFPHSEILIVKTDLLVEIDPPNEKDLP